MFANWPQCPRRSSVPTSRLRDRVGSRETEAIVHPLALTASRRESAGLSFPFLALTMVVVALLAGLVVTIIDKEDFPSYGVAVWWAIVTVGTVGYGDVVPHTGWGRVVGSVVIVVGVTFIAFLTAVVTSLFV